jgi:hypothetical protein
MFISARTRRKPDMDERKKDKTCCIRKDDRYVDGDQPRYGYAFSENKRFITKKSAECISKEAKRKEKRAPKPKKASEQGGRQQQLHHPPARHHAFRKCIRNAVET